MSRRWSRIRYRDILRRWNWIRYRGILIMRIGIDACCGGCIRSRDNRIRIIGKYGSYNFGVGLRGNTSRKIVRDISGCCKKFRGNISSGGCWNRHRVNMSRVDRSKMVGRDTS